MTGKIDPDPINTALTTWRGSCLDAGWSPHHHTEHLPLDQAIGRINAETLHAKWSCPAEQRAAMDGIAVHAADTTTASPNQPLRLNPADYHTVDTGDPLPAGRDAVIMHEHLHQLDNELIELIAPVTTGRHVRPVGEDITRGEPLLPAGHRIRPVDAAVLANAGHTELAVQRRPVVAVIPTGDEIRPIGTTLKHGEILDTNSLMLTAQAHQAGCTTTTTPIIPDDPQQLAEAVLAAAEQADLVLVLAGSSAGHDDYTTEVLTTVGKIAVHSVAIRPGHPVILGVIHGAKPVPVIGIPGYPVSAAHIFTHFAQPMINTLLNTTPTHRRLLPATLARPIAAPGPTETQVLLRLDRCPTRGWLAVPISRGAAALSSLMRADAILRLPAGSEALTEGNPIKVEELTGAPNHQRP